MAVNNRLADAPWPRMTTFTLSKGVLFMALQKKITFKRFPKTTVRIANQRSTDHISLKFSCSQCTRTIRHHRAPQEARVGNNDPNSVHRNLT